MKRYSTKVLGMKTSSEYLVVVFGVDNVRRVLTDSAFDARPHNFFSQLRCLGKKNMGITFANGEMWREHRQYVVKHLKHVGYGKSAMEVEIQKELKEILGYINGVGSEPINLEGILSESVMNVLWKFVAGERIEKDKLRRLLELFRQRGKAFTLGGGLLNFLPWCRFIIPEISGYKLIMQVNHEISNIIKEAIIKHRNKAIQVEDFIYQFLKEIDENQKESFTEDQLKIVCLDLLISGSHTSSTLLGFAFLKALLRQDIQEKMYKEICTIIGDRTPCWNDNERLTYTSAFLLEVHRYYSIAPMLGPRQAQECVSLDGYLIPKGATVLISIADVHHSTELWEKPQEFRPERFIDDAGKLKKLEHMYHFGAGRRRCPGDALAKSYTFITLVGILQKYQIVPSHGALPSEDPITGILSSPTPYTAVFVPRQ